jgi:hypothetical protein
MLRDPWYVANLVIRIGTPGAASAVIRTSPPSASTEPSTWYSLSVSTTWSTPTARVIRLLVVRYPSRIRLSYCSVTCALSTLSGSTRASRGSSGRFSGISSTGRVSCRLTTIEVIATGAPWSSIVTSYVIATMCRCSQETRRVERIRACLPLASAQTNSRVRVPARMSSTRR